MVPRGHGLGEGLLTGEGAFAERAARAEALAATAGPAQELLSFAASLLRLQAAARRALAGAHSGRPFAGRIEDDAAALVPAWDEFLRGLRDSPAPEVAAEAAQRVAEDAAAHRAALVQATSGSAEREDLLARTFLRPYFELLREVAIPIRGERADGACPLCGGLPGVAVRRAGPESQAGHRYLVCSRCGGEWATARIRCPFCQEVDPEKLPVFSSEKHPGTRLEACDSCRRYVKSIDLTVDGRASPEVDDLSSIALDLWAQEQGYQRIAPGIAGI